MGTRPYAHAVAKVLDPTGELFNDRILSRDESGSFTLKSIQRLFPCDQSMVVVVDDRADVWQWSPNLLKVRPYIFFQGIGDINEPIPLTEPNSKENVNDLVTQNKHTKLAKVSNHEQEKVNRPMLLDFDYDLKYLQQTVVSIHEKFYGLRDKNAPADSREIITSLKQRVLRGTTILFSAVIPLGVEPETHDLWRFAVSFGATCTSELSNHVTHVIAINVYISHKARNNQSSPSKVHCTYLDRDARVVDG
jgi:RNA polymerase II subunit A-like phosphatase